MTRQVLMERNIESAPTIGLAWLVRLRWAFAIAELALAGAATWVFDMEVELWMAGGAVAATLATNLALHHWASPRPAPNPPAHRWSARVSARLTWILLFDGLLLTIALWGAGGVMNPFSVLYLVHVALAALLLDRRGTWIVAGATCLGFGVLFARGGGGHYHHHFEAHLRGMFAAYAIAAAFVGYFVDRVARALERREREMIALKRLASLTALAAGAAHELGTPLATIAIVAKELERAASGPLDRAALASDAQLVREEAERCRRIIAKMTSSAGEGQGAAPRRAAALEVIESVRSSLDKPRASELRIEVASPGAFVVAPHDALVQVLINLVTNAFDARVPARTPRIVLGAEAQAGRIAFRVEDDGCGMPEDVLRRLGEPFFSLKQGRGMGLGIFLARSFAERVGGSLEVSSRPGVGSTFVLELPGGIA